MLGLVVGFTCLLFGGFMILGGAVRRASCPDWEHSTAKDTVDTGLVLVMLSLLIIAGSFIWCLAEFAGRMIIVVRLFRR